MRLDYLLAQQPWLFGRGEHVLSEIEQLRYGAVVQHARRSLHALCEATSNELRRGAERTHATFVSLPQGAIAQVFRAPEGTLLVAETLSLLIESARLALPQWIPTGRAWRSIHTLECADLRLRWFVECAKAVARSQDGLETELDTPSETNTIGLPGMAVAVSPDSPNRIRVAYRNDRWVTCGNGGQLRVLPRFKLGTSGVQINNVALGLATGLAATQKVCDDADFDWDDVPQISASIIELATPEIVAEMNAVVQYVVPIVAQSEQEFPSATSTLTPGALYCAATGRPEMLAEMVVHEFAHSKLNALQSATTLFAASNPPEPRFLSPFTMTKRPLIGILHGLYASFYMSHLWRRVSQLREYRNFDTIAERRTVRLAEQMAAAREILTTHARFSRVGDELFKALQVGFTGQ